MTMRFHAGKSTARRSAGVIGAVMVGLEPIVFLVGGVYAAMVYSAIVSALRI